MTNDEMRSANEIATEETMRCVVTGATGAMGQELRTVAQERGIGTAAVSRTADGATRPDELSELLDTQPDALIDFTVPEASVEYVTACAESGTPVVIGTTGFDDEQQATIREAAERTAVLKAANFSRGIQTLLSLVRESVSSLPAYDIELTETHHNRKRDAPSGTANMLLGAIDAATQSETRDRVYGREGIDPRSEDEIGVHVRRAGNIRGEHELLFAGNDEILTLTHRAESRRVFAAGALDGAEWLSGKEAGWYEFTEVLTNE